MKYNDYLNSITDCNFCDLKSNRIIRKREKAYLTNALAPYCKHHLLVIPYRHVEEFGDLNDEEKKDIDRLLISGMKSLKLLGHNGCNILLRNGENIGKTIKHLHYHLIPTVEVGSLTGNHIDRQIMTEKEVDQLINEISSLD